MTLTASYLRGRSAWLDSHVRFAAACGRFVIETKNQPGTPAT